MTTSLVAGQKVDQQDPCQAKNKVVGDATYCDRYWECLTGEQELYDCPNGLVWVGKNRGIADGCDYPWRNPNICRGKDLASKSMQGMQDEHWTHLPISSYDQVLFACRKPQQNPI